VLNLSGLDSGEIDALLDRVAVGDVWGIGRKYAYFLEHHKIKNARELKYARKDWIRKRLGVCGLRVVCELEGMACLALSENLEPRKEIASTRSFGRPVESLAELKEAVAAYATRAAEKLRRDKSVAGAVSVFIKTSRFRVRDAQYANLKTFRFPVATSFTPEIITAAHELLDAMYRTGYRYKKAGVLLSSLVPDARIQQNLFTGGGSERKNSLMRSVDVINARWGSGTVRSAAAPTDRPWKMKQERRSPCYTTRWEELLRVK
jgi:DNA polymerase V